MLEQADRWVCNARTDRQMGVQCKNRWMDGMQEEAADGCTLQEQVGQRFDIKAAFDQKWHQEALAKLESMGIWRKSLC